MTENLAGRGEGLAGLRELSAKASQGDWELCEDTCRTCREKGVTEWDIQGVDKGHHAMFAGKENAEFIVAAVKYVRAALEAAAPAGTPDVHWAIKADCARCRESYPQRHGKPDYIPNFGNVEAGDWTHPCTAEHDWRYCQAAKIHEALFAAALATPSPQAPQQESSFSTTSAREQSSATASGNLSAADFAEIPATQAVLLGVATDLLERGKEAMECDPQADVVGDDCWIWLKQTELWLEQVRALPTATQEQPAGSGAVEQRIQELAMVLPKRWRAEIEKCCPVLLKDANSNFADASCRQRDVEELEAALGGGDLLTQILDFLDEATPEGDTSHWAARAYQEIAKKFNGGSPRKVGEDAATEKYERTHSRVWTNAWNAAIEECAKHLREGWSVANKDNGDDVMEVLMEELGGLMLPTPSIVGGPSSVPVGEQKQEESRG